MAKEYLPTRSVMTGNAFPVDSSQRRNVQAYHQRIASGKIFGARTHELLPQSGEISERIDAYFQGVEDGLNRLGNVYGLEKSSHLGGDFADVKEEATRIMWTYGITTELFDDDQRGLFLLGAASTNLYLRGKEGIEFENERKRMRSVVRMLAQTHRGETSSVKVDEWLRRADEKAESAKSEEDTRLQKIYMDRADIERIYTDSNDLGKLGRSYREDANSNTDETASEFFNINYSTMPHIIKAMERMGLDTVPTVNWVVTNYSKDEFEKKYKAGAFCINSTIFTPTVTNTPRFRSNLQHEFDHAVMRPRATFYLGSGMEEADAERIVDYPDTYSDERLLSFYVDDVINSSFGKLGEKKAEIARMKAGIKGAEGVLNSKEEIIWNTLLTKVFGLEGYLTYYMVDSDGQMNKAVKDQLLDAQQGAYRLMGYADFYAGKSNVLPEGFYLNAIYYEGIFDAILAIWEKSTGRNIRGEALNVPTELGKKLSADQLFDLSLRVNAHLQNYVAYSTSEEKLQLQLDELAWMKQRYPYIFDGNGSYPIDIFADEGKPLTSLGEDELKDMQTMTRKTLRHLRDVEDIDKQLLYNSLCYILLRSASGEFDMEINSEIQKKFGQAVIFAHKQIAEEEQGNQRKIIARLRDEVLEPLTSEDFTVNDFISLLNPVILADEIVV